MSISNPCLQCGQDPCSQCPQTPCIPVAPPPSCGLGSAACDEYILSDCVISTIDGSCTVIIQTPDGPIEVGLQITEGMTLTQILNQLVDTACIFSPNMQQAFFQQLISNTNLFTQIFGDIITNIFNNPILTQQFITDFFNSILNNNALYQFFSNIICDIDCDDPCELVDEVEQMVFTNIASNGFELNWVAMPCQTYSIRINDSQTVPTTYYEYVTPNPPSPCPPNNLPVAAVLLTSVFSKYENGVLVANNGLASNTSFEVYITAIKTVNGDPVECETGPFTITTLSDAGCGPCNTVIDVQNSNSNPAGPGELSADISYQAGFVPIGYYVIVTSITTGLVVNGPPTGVFIPAAVPGPITNYSILLPDDDYDVEAIPVCSLIPLCTSDPANVVITVNPAAFCAPPDITSVSIG